MGTSAGEEMHRAVCTASDDVADIASVISVEFLDGVVDGWDDTEEESNDDKSPERRDFLLLVPKNGWALREEWVGPLAERNAAVRGMICECENPFPALSVCI